MKAKVKCFNEITEVLDFIDDGKMQVISIATERIFYGTKFYVFYKESEK